MSVSSLILWRNQFQIRQNKYVPKISGPRMSSAKSMNLYPLQHFLMEGACWTLCELLSCPLSCLSVRLCVSVAAWLCGCVTVWLCGCVAVRLWVCMSMFLDSWCVLDQRRSKGQCRYRHFTGEIIQLLVRPHHLLHFPGPRLPRKMSSRIHPLPHHHPKLPRNNLRKEISYQMTGCVCAWTGRWTFVCTWVCVCHIRSLVCW